MIALHILKLLEDNGFGTIDVDLFFEEAALDSAGKPKQGVWIMERGTDISRNNIYQQNFDIYSRYTSKLTGYKRLEDILDFLNEAYGTVCDLPQVPPYSTVQYKNVQIIPTSAVENVGVDDNGKIVRSISGYIRYSK